MSVASNHCGSTLLNSSTDTAWLYLKKYNPIFFDILSSSKKDKGFINP